VLLSHSIEIEDMLSVFPAVRKPAFDDWRYGAEDNDCLRVERLARDSNNMLTAALGLIRAQENGQLT
jgi:hypothetical protein